MVLGKRQQRSCAQVCHSLSSYMTVAVAYNQPSLFVVCDRVLRASRDLAAREAGLSVSQALGKFCSVETLETEDVKFCYNIDTIKKDIYRLLDLGANNDRVCKKVHTINSDFCRVRHSSSTPTIGSMTSDENKSEIRNTDNADIQFNDVKGGAVSIEGDVIALYPSPPGYPQKRGFIYI